MDFQQFPSQLVKLLEETKRGAGPPGSALVPQSPAHHNQSFVSSPGTIGASLAGGASMGAIFAVLNIVSGHEALFSITESNQFRELQHLSLHFRILKFLTNIYKRTSGADLRLSLHVRSINTSHCLFVICHNHFFL